MGIEMLYLLFVLALMIGAAVYFVVWSGRVAEREGASGWLHAVKANLRELGEPARRSFQKPASRSMRRAVGDGLADSVDARREDDNFGTANKQMEHYYYLWSHSDGHYFADIFGDNAEAGGFDRDSG